MTPLLHAAMALADALAAGDLAAAKECALRIGHEWALSRHTIPPIEQAVCLVGMRATWEQADLLGSIVQQGAFAVRQGIWRGR